MTIEKMTQTYTTLAGAKKGAKRAGVQDPTFETNKETGRVEVSYTVEKTTPVAMYRKLFTAKFGKITWSEMISEAVAMGIKENTAKTYYYKLKAEQIETV